MAAAAVQLTIADSDMCHAARMRNQSLPIIGQAPDFSGLIRNSCGIFLYISAFPLVIYRGYDKLLYDNGGKPNHLDYS
jgi:hypothetical protein